MAKKKQSETIEDILDRMEEDMQAIRDKVWELEENQDDEIEDDEDEE
jgi:hypothetical protein